MQRTTRALDLADVSNVRCIFVEQPDCQLAQGQYHTNSLTRDAENGIACVHPSRAPDLEEICCEGTLHERLVKPSRLDPHGLLESSQLSEIFR
jgi:hypothetical protein